MGGPGTPKGWQGVWGFQLMGVQLMDVQPRAGVGCNNRAMNMPPGGSAILLRYSIWGRLLLTGTRFRV